MDGQFLAQIQPMAFNFAPKGWAQCAAQLLAINANQALFSILGTTYGGNGIQTFGLPDLRGRVAIGAGQGPGLSDYVLGEMSGNQAVIMLQTNMPQHTHLFNVSNQTSTQPSPASTNSLAQGGVFNSNNLFLYGPSAGATMAPGMIGYNGGSVPFSVIQPYLTLTYCIATVGIFPSRN